ncbi:XRE family transcriptional regulator [Dehalobacterium formicoaceticum]|uniref:XRE family transcriptional regulator n=1 Tax=Dehalobacterium formicoaceticum TaxID=51515 RepID=A0ABT1Y6F6_9FIRM|nr:XRE family transcriptional regulator [Dehalobacterium formicoaceticum]MCR6546467.1 XRE family transcriptional regulator [Dehalobacterium formicoaceticum]
MFDESLKKLRKDKMISQKSLSEALQLSRSTIAQYEGGTRTPDLQTLIRIAQFFDVSIDELLGHEPERRKMDLKDQDYIFFSVKDNSMQNARILEGDVAVIKKQDTFENGDIVLLTMHNQEPLIRKVVLKDHIVALIPEHPDYEVVLDNMLEVAILGKVIGISFV